VSFEVLSFKSPSQSHSAKVKYLQVRSLFGLEVKLGAEQMLHHHVVLRFDRRYARSQGRVVHERTTEAAARLRDGKPLALARKGSK
jgi:hypothetical protein